MSYMDEHHRKAIAAHREKKQPPEGYFIAYGTWSLKSFASVARAAHVAGCITFEARRNERLRAATSRQSHKRQQDKGREC